MKISEYSLEVVTEALEDCASIKEFLTRLGRPINNGNYRNAACIVRQYGLELPKFDFAQSARFLGSKQEIPNEELFTKGNRLPNGQSLKRRLIRDFGFKDICDECGQLPEWNGKPLVLQLDHVNGDRFDNRRENLRILCPHCHTQTDTFSNKRSKKDAKNEKRYSLCECGARKHKDSLRCASCVNKNRTGHGAKIEWPPVSEVLEMINNSNFYQVGKELGVSDNAVRKYLRRNKIDPKTLKSIVG